MSLLASGSLVPLAIYAVLCVAVGASLARARKDEITQ
jgi:hypothetical protein